MDAGVFYFLYFSMENDQDIVMGVNKVGGNRLFKWMKEKIRIPYCTNRIKLTFQVFISVIQTV